MRAASPTRTGAWTPTPSATSGTLLLNIRNVRLIDFSDVERRLKSAVDEIPAKMREKSVSAIWPDRLKEVPQQSLLEYNILKFLF